MKIIVKKFNKGIRKYQKLGEFTVNPKSTVLIFKQSLSEKLKIPPNGFYIESEILTVKILLTDSFTWEELFNNQDSITVNLEIFLTSLPPRPEKKTIINTLVDLVVKGKVHEVINSMIQLALNAEDLSKGTQLNGWQLIHYVSLYGHEEILSNILTMGCNANAETDDAWTPLMLAAAHGQSSCVAVFLKSLQIQVNKVTKRGTALHLAVEYNNVEVVSLLLNARACCTIENYNKKIPLELANDEDIIQLIPKYQGQWELQKYIKKNISVLHSGDITEYCHLQISDKLSFLVVNAETGFLEIYTSRESWMKKKHPRECIKIVEIQQVTSTKPLFVSTQKFFFKVVFKEGKKIFYTSNERRRTEWIQCLNDGVKYCQLHKIGFDNSNFKSNNLAIHINELSLSPEDFKILEELGSGSFGTVFKVIKNDTQEVFAMKKLSIRLLQKKKMLKYAISECKIMQDLNHPFIIKLYYSFETPTYIFLILELCPNGDLEGLIEKTPLSEAEAKFFLAEIIEGIEYLHSHDIIYRDLKPANILLDSDGHIKLADFGISKDSNSKEEAVSTLIGSPAYISPEILCYEKLSKASDIYSLGIVMHELITGIVPFADFDIGNLFNCIKTSDFEISEKLSREARDLIVKLIDRNTWSRPSLGDIKKHEFFKGVNWNTVRNKKYSRESFL